MAETDQVRLDNMCPVAGGLTNTTGNLGTWLQAVRTLQAALKTQINSIRTVLQGDFLVSLPSLSTGTNSANVASVAFDYQIGGARYSKAAVSAGTALSGSGSVPQSAYGAFALQLGTNGTVDIIEAAANSAGYASAALAVAGIPSVAADHARMGTVSVYNAGGAFTPGTTKLDAATVTSAYTEGSTAYQSIAAAVSAATPATLA